MRRTLLAFLSLLLLAPPSTSAHQPTPAELQPPPYLAHVEGVTALEREGTVQAGAPNEPLVAGDRLRTDRGRLEAVFPDGSVLQLDHGSVLDLLDSTLVRLSVGRARLVVGRTAVVDSTSYRVDVPAGTVEAIGPGEYDIEVNADGQLRVAVIRGAAVVTSPYGQTTIRAGEETTTTLASAPSAPRLFNSAALDEFSRWAETRRRSRLSSAASYLPTPVLPYAGTLEGYGTWSRDPNFGFVWYPRVGPHWRPYLYGRWSSVPGFGRTWIGVDAWAWPTHHFGTWKTTSSGVWFWIPGARWAPAWVVWASGPGFVAWCPVGLGHDTRQGWRDHRERRGGRWEGWTVARREPVDAGRRIDQHAIDPGRLGDGALEFVRQDRVAVPRGLQVPVRRAPAADRIALPHVPAPAAPVPRAGQPPRTRTIAPNPMTRPATPVPASPAYRDRATGAVGVPPRALDRRVAAPTRLALPAAGAAADRRPRPYFATPPSMNRTRALPPRAPSVRTPSGMPVGALPAVPRSPVLSSPAPSVPYNPGGLIGALPQPAPQPARQAAPRQ